jgi:hypothetical protein
MPYSRNITHFNQNRIIISGIFIVINEFHINHVNRIVSWLQNVLVELSNYF